MNPSPIIASLRCSAVTNMLATTALITARYIAGSTG